MAAWCRPNRDVEGQQRVDDVTIVLTAVRQHAGQVQSFADDCYPAVH